MKRLPSLKDSSLVSIMAISELTRRGTELTSTDELPRRSGPLSPCYTC